ncbi:putative WD domain-containing protein [Rosellinia necatrix]|uniref:Putative WD domain-containing protein n=1 Tax=Rosellinia necatrix TaxID=77044 RepID=A0A1S8AA36_ROSNE|nr:putative WD domain-containing protein [Rosellinia necatrix]
MSQCRLRCSLLRHAQSLQYDILSEAGPLEHLGVVREEISGVLARPQFRGVNNTLRSIAQDARTASEILSNLGSVAIYVASVVSCDPSVDGAGESDGRFHVRMWPIFVVLVMMASSVNVIQVSGSVSAILVNTGGSIATFDRGSTG